MAKISMVVLDEYCNNLKIEVAPDANLDDKVDAFVKACKTRDPQMYKTVSEELDPEAPSDEEFLTALYEQTLKTSKGASGLSSDPYKDDNGGSGSSEPKELTPQGGTKDNTGQKKAKDVTSELADSLDPELKDALYAKLVQEWDVLKRNSQESKITQICLGADYLSEVKKNQTFKITDKEYIDKFENNYRKNLEASPDNVKAFDEIIRKMRAGEVFDTAIPEITSLRVDGVSIKFATDAEPMHIYFQNLGHILLAKCGGRIPGSPGVQATKVMASGKASNGGAYAKVNNTSLKTQISGKKEAIETNSVKVVFTCEPVVVPGGKAGKAGPDKTTRNYTIRAKDTFKYLGKENKVLTGRPTTSIPVPIFKRKEEFASAGFPPIKTIGVIAPLTDGDMEEVQKLVSAALKANEGESLAKTLGLSLGKEATVSDAASVM